MFEIRPRVSAKLTDIDEQELTDLQRKSFETTPPKAGTDFWSYPLSIPSSAFQELIDWCSLQPHRGICVPDLEAGLIAYFDEANGELVLYEGILRYQVQSSLSTYPGLSGILYKIFNTPRAPHNYPPDWNLTIALVPGNAVMGLLTSGYGFSTSDLTLEPPPGAVDIAMRFVDADYPNTPSGLAYTLSPLLSTGHPIGRAIIIASEVRPALRLDRATALGNLLRRQPRK